MILYFNNPYDKISVNTLQFLFINDALPFVVNRTSPADDKGFHISFLPTVILCDNAYKEYARIEDYKLLTLDAFNWLHTQDLLLNQEKPMDGTTPPAGVIVSI